MRYLLFMDELREGGIWAVLALLFGLAVYLACSPRMLRSWRRAAVRAVGLGLLGLLGVLAGVLFVGAWLGGDPPREHIVFKSHDGARVALLSHSSLRDSSATQVTVKGNNCCSRYIAYDYYGDGDDYMGPNSIRWADDHHLAIRYTVDTTGSQVCHPLVGDVQIVCEPQSKR